MLRTCLDSDIFKEQAEERKLREECAWQHGCKDSEEIMKVVSLHHCIAVMSRKAKEYRAKFSPSHWVLDVGCGTGYYWRNSCGAKLIMMDFAFGNLKATQTLLKEQGSIFFVQADAANPPFKSNSLSGIWSVQVTQHFPCSVMASFLKNAKRVLRMSFLMEIYNLNPALLVKTLYILLGKRMRLKGKIGNMTLNRLNAVELLEIWRGVSVNAKFKIGYSELFFHPDLHFKPQGRYIEFLEIFFNRIPGLSHLFSRQIQIIISDGSF